MANKDDSINEPASTPEPEDDDRGRARDPETRTMDRITRLLEEHDPPARADIMDYLHRRYCRRNGGAE